MRMINDMDMYYAAAYADAKKPVWMKSERLEYCDMSSKDKKKSSFTRLFGHKNVK